jgi:SSS family solute:Na+ symporter
MGAILGRWRTFAVNLMVTLLSVCGLVYLKTPRGIAVVHQALAGIPNAATADQMRIAVILVHLTPAGIRGALASVCLMGMIAGDGIHLHSWGSILVQDVILPLRKRHMSTKHHLLLLRLSIVAVAIWAFVFGALFPQTEYVQIWWSVTQAIFCAGAGAAIIGGLYWRRGTTSGAWVSMILGAVLTLIGMGLRLYYQNWLGREFPLNGQQIAFYVTLIAMISYIVISYLTCRTPHDMDRLLHRGKYAVEPEGSDTEEPARKNLNWGYRLMGIDEHFSPADRWITIGIFLWTMAFLVIFVIGSLLYLIHPWSNRAWANYWLVTGIFVPLLLGIVTTIWFTIGGFRDMAVFFRRLRLESINPQDDGVVPEKLVVAGVPLTVRQ